MKAVHAALRRWPPPDGLTRAQIAGLDERHGRIERDLLALAKEPQGPRTSHRLMALAAECQAMREAVGLAHPAEMLDLDAEGETREAARWFEQERQAQDRVRTIEARQLPGGSKLFRQQIKQADRLARAVAQAARDSTAVGRSGVDARLLAENERAGRQLAAAVERHPEVTHDAAVMSQRLAELGGHPDAACFRGELKEIRKRLDESLARGRSRHGGWHQAAASLKGAQTWLARLESDLQLIAALPGGWRRLVTDTRALAPKARAAVEQRAFRAARLLCLEHCPPEEAMRGARRVESAVARGCPETSALMNERVHRALTKQLPEGIVDPLVRMLRMDGSADYPDALAVLRVMARLPAAMADRLARAGVTILPSPCSTADVLPDELLRAAEAQTLGLFRHASKQIVVTTSRTGTGETVAARPSNPLHEAAHAYEHLVGKLTHHDAAFSAARDSDCAAGHIDAQVDGYYVKSNQDAHSDPIEETFVQSLAMYLLGDRRWPALHAYWAARFRSGDLF